MTRLSTVRLAEMAGELSERDRRIVQAAARLRLVSSPQCERLFFAATPMTNPASQARLARRALARLVELRLLGRLERRIGGIRAGAAGHVYYPTSAAQRLVAYWQGEGLRRPRSRYEPTTSFVRHTLGISESYVQLVEADRAGATQLLEFQAEAWLPFIGPGNARMVLKPDAFARLGVSAEEEERLYLEIDCGTEGRAALTRKCRTYLMAWQAGAGGEVFPRVVWITATERRVSLLTEVCAAMPAEAWKLFVVTTPEKALADLIGTPPEAQL